ncbi:hypothetical protein [Citricoccus sp.]|uniref:hypothetical protein n=1 Tax=Citricoccus sp. TaxID=1978372 RepID=UPI0028BD8AF6|nr:hypothetical protein [Citricoccus sp.]
MTPSLGLKAPAPFDLPAGLRETTPTCQRAAIHHVAGQAEWTALDWPGLVEVLMALGRTDIPLARLTEGHVDALRVMAEAGATPDPDALYGVWASRSGGTGLSGKPVRGGWQLTGRLLFASGAGVLDRALVTVWPEEDRHLLLDVAVSDWSFDTSAWRTRAMEHSRSHRIELDAVVSARQIGANNFYLTRSSFFPGGVGVAAVWTGGAARVLDLLAQSTEVPAAASDPRRVRLGRARTDLASAVALVRQTAIALRASHVGGARDSAGQGQAAEHQELLRTLATLCRAGVGAAVRRIVEEVRALAGPAGLAFDEDLNRAVDDVALYVAQQSQDGDAVYVGGAG